MVFTDPEEGRHAVRILAVTMASDVGQSQNATIERILKINGLSVITDVVVEAARSTLVIGVT